jgi:hypothetical protein
LSGPVGHVITALALLSSPGSDIVDRSAFMAGNLLPDIRYIADISRSRTHELAAATMTEVLKPGSDYEKGRRFHVLVDIKREKYMRQHDAYDLVPKGPLKTQMLKTVEDHILRDRLPKNFVAADIFKRSYPEEKIYGLSDDAISRWHGLLTCYLGGHHMFNFMRYFDTLSLFQEAYGLPPGFFARLWSRIRTFSFFVYAYFQVEKLSRDEKLRKIILDFYEGEIHKIISGHDQKPVPKHSEKTDDRMAYGAS